MSVELNRFRSDAGALETGCLIYRGLYAWRQGFGKAKPRRVEPKGGGCGWHGGVCLSFWRLGMTWVVRF